LIVTFTPNEAQFANGIAVPGGKKWKLKLVHIEWTSDVNAGNRVIELRIRDQGVGGVDIYKAASRNNQAASLVTHYNFVIGISHVGSGSGLHQTIPLPDLSLTEGMLITLADSASIAAGDSIAHGYIYVEEESVLENEIESDRVI